MSTEDLFAAETPHTKLPPELTEWFTYPEQKPTEPGVYLVTTNQGVGYSFYNQTVDCWGESAASPGEAEYQCDAKGHPSYWCGLASDPNAA